MELENYERFVLTEDIPEEGLAAGDVGTIVMIHKAGKGNYPDPDGYHAEFTYLDGRTRALVGLHPHQVRPIEEGEVARAARPAGAPASGA